jgi:hypothetical protein
MPWPGGSCEGEMGAMSRKEFWHGWQAMRYPSFSRCPPCLPPLSTSSASAPSPSIWTTHCGHLTPFTRAEGGIASAADRACPPLPGPVCRYHGAARHSHAGPKGRPKTCLRSRRGRWVSTRSHGQSLLNPLCPENPCVLLPPHCPSSDPLD